MKGKGKSEFRIPGNADGGKSRIAGTRYSHKSLECIDLLLILIDAHGDRFARRRGKGNFVSEHLEGKFRSKGNPEIMNDAVGGGHAFVVSAERKKAAAGNEFASADRRRIDDNFIEGDTGGGHSVEFLSFLFVWKSFFADRIDSACLVSAPVSGV